MEWDKKQYSEEERRERLRNIGKDRGREEERSVRRRRGRKSRRRRRRAEEEEVKRKRKRRVETPSEGLGVGGPWESCHS